MESDSDVCCEPAVATGRCGRQLVIVDDDSRDGDESSVANTVEILDINHVIADNAREAASRQQNQYTGDDLFSEDSGSLEALLDKLTLKPSKEADEDIGILDDEQSLGSEEESSDSENEDAEDVDTDDPGSAWCFDQGTQEYFLSKRKVSDVAWPGLRLPKHVFSSLYDHQKTGIQWMAQRHAEGVGGILGDDMGMGKTYTTAAFLGGLMKAKLIKNAVIVAPKSVLRSWEKELKRVVLKCAHKTMITVMESNASPLQRRRMLTAALECSHKHPHIVITTYGMISNELNLFKSDTEYWDYVVLDEAHNIKNSKTQISLACCSLAHNPETHRVMLSGTPLMNKPEELYNLIKWACSGSVLGTPKRFKEYFVKPIIAARDKDASAHDVRLGKKVGEELQTVLKPYLLQRLKKDVLAHLLPSKHEFVVWTRLSSMQRTEYTHFVKNGALVQNILAGFTSSALPSIAWLKKLCGSSMLVDDAVKDDVKSALAQMKTQEVLQHSAKLEVLSAMVPELIQQGHRTLIFSQSTKMLDIIEFVLRSIIGDRIARIDGSTKESNRQKFVDAFNDSDGRFDVMLLSTHAGGVGLTLTGASRSIIFDPDFNPALDAQAVDRCYRLGQTKEVIVYRMITGGCIEEKIYEKQVHKDGIKRAVFSDEGAEKLERHFNRSELTQLFKLGDDGVADFMHKANKEAVAAGLCTDWNAHDFISSHPGVLGLSRHDGLYLGTGTMEEAIDDAPVDSTVSSVLGRAQRILQSSAFEPPLPLKTLATNTNAAVASSPPTIHKTSAANPIYLDITSEDSTTSRESVLEDDEAVAFPVDPSDPTIFTVLYGMDSSGQKRESAGQENDLASNLQNTLALSKSLQVSGKPRRALKVLLNYLVQDSSNLDGSDKIRLHKEIVRQSDALKLM